MKDYSFLERFLDGWKVGLLISIVGLLISILFEVSEIKEMIHDYLETAQTELIE